MLKDILEESIANFTNPHLMSVNGTTSVTNAVKIMTEAQVDFVLVSEGDIVEGIVTDKDILSDVVAKGKNPAEIQIKEIAHRPLVKIQNDSKVKDAISIMTDHDIRRLIVTEQDKPIGTISQKKIVGDLTKHDVNLPELDKPNEITCPYCESPFSDKDTLSKHIDNIHIGKGLLEGNLEQA